MALQLVIQNPAPELHHTSKKERCGAMHRLNCFCISNMHQIGKNSVSKFQFFQATLHFVAAQLCFLSNITLIPEKKSFQEQWRHTPSFYCYCRHFFTALVRCSGADFSRSSCCLWPVCSSSDTIFFAPSLLASLGSVTRMGGQTDST